MYQGFGTMIPIFVKKAEILNNRHGHFHHDDLIGKKYGSKVFARTSQSQGSRRPGWMYVLQPTAELWSTCVTQRTQIVQPSDQAIIISQLWLKGGSVVLESGTGSGIFTTALARVIAPSGHVHTFEFNEHRSKVAAKEFVRNGIGKDVVTVTHRDVCGEGFPRELDKKADAVFLDVPNPWLAIPHAKNALKAGGRVCTYSPCVEQVQRNCESMEKNGFHSIETIEVRLRHLDVRETKFILPTFKTKKETIAQFEAYVERRAKADERRKEKEAADKEAADKEVADKEAADKNVDETALGKRPASCDGKEGKNKKSKKEWHGQPKIKLQRLPKPTTTIGTACPVPLMRGHTAFLSFATRDERV